MGKPFFRRLVLVLACLLVIMCQTTHPGTKSQSAAEGPQSTAQGQQPAAQAQQLSAAQPEAPPRARSGVPGALAARSGKLVQAVSAGFRNLVSKIETLGKRGLKLNLSLLKTRVLGAHMPPAGLTIAIVTALVLLGGASLTAAAIIAGRRKGRGPVRPVS